MTFEPIRVASRILRKELGRAGLYKKKKVRPMVLRIDAVLPRGGTGIRDAGLVNHAPRFIVYAKPKTTGTKHRLNARKILMLQSSTSEKPLEGCDN